MTNFYNSREWKELRYKVINIHGRKCLCCNASDKPIHVDHIKPISKYPELALEISNLQVLCEDCNLGKSNIDETDFRVNKFEIIKLPPKEYCWVKFNSNTIHRWSGRDTICKIIENGYASINGIKDYSKIRIKGKFCGNCRKMLYFGNSSKIKPLNNNSKTILRKKPNNLLKL